MNLLLDVLVCSIAFFIFLRVVCAAQLVKIYTPKHLMIYTYWILNFVNLTQDSKLSVCI